MEAEAEAVNIKLMKAEAEAVKKILEAEAGAGAIKIYRFHLFYYSGIRGKIFLFFQEYFQKLNPS